LGTPPFDAAAAAATGEVHCVFTVAPRSLPVFDRPYSGAHLAVTAQSYNHDGYNSEIDVTDFGEDPAPGHPFAHYVDLNGRQMCNAQNGHQAGFGVLNGVDEPAVDIGVGSDRIALAVAPGRVAWAVPRYVPYATPVGLDPHQREVFVRHRIGSGLYREEFTLFYAHMSDTRVRRGDVVAAGAQLGRIGNTGASGGDHLHLAALRHRNLSFRQSWEHGYAFAGFDDDERLRAASFDPWGWRGPAGTDPWATRFRNVPGRPLNSGSWSPNLWKAGEAPTME
jgi:murein DD-endopeptidase MepM/ murein hydrolase activator NlpD